MPCYCDTPDESDQIEIQKRCKVRMYFHAISILDEYSLKKADLMGIKISRVLLPDTNTALCNICKILSDKQMQDISAYYYQINWEHKTLLDWYRQHCEDDKKHSEMSGVSE